LNSQLTGASLPGNLTRVICPAGQGMETRAGVIGEAKGSGMGRPPRVLVVEDEQDIAGLIKHALERSGDGIVQIVASGDVALRAVNEQPPDLVILDLNLPVLSGTEVCRLLRSH